jgi:hypothetical protein
MSRAASAPLTTKAPPPSEMRQQSNFLSGSVMTGDAR